MTQSNTGYAQLKSYVDRISRVQGEVDDLRTDIKEIYAEAKANGFHVGHLKAAIALRKKFDSAPSFELWVAERELYLTAVGLAPEFERERELSEGIAKIQAEIKPFVDLVTPESVASVDDEDDIPASLRRAK